MKTLVTIILFCSWFNIYSQEKEKQPNIGDYADSREIGRYIKGKLPDGWTCTYDYTEIVIKRDKPITVVNGVNLPIDRNRTLKDYGMQTSYFMTLHFVPKLKKEQYDSLLLFQKNQLSKVSPDDAYNKYEETNKIIRQFLIPRYYNSRFSVYFHQTDTGYLKVIPKSVEQETKLVLQIIESLLKKYSNH